MSRQRIWTTGLFLLLVSLALEAPRTSQGKVYIDIDSPGFRPLPLAIVSVPLPPGESPCPADVAQALLGVIKQDLEISGYLRVLDPGSFLVDLEGLKLHPAKIDFRAWTLIGAESLILLQIRCEDGDLRCDAQLLDPLTGKLLTWKRYRSDPKNHRQVAHRFANEVERELTGTAGAFDTQIAYVSDATGFKELYVMDYDGHGAKQVSRLGALSLLPGWSPDGRMLAFTSYWKGSPGLYRLRLKGETELEALLPGFSPLCSGAAWAPDGETLAFSASLEGNTEIFGVPTATWQDPKRLTRSWAIDVSPTWSPEGDRMVFVSDRAGRPDLYVLKVRENKVRRLTFEGSYNADPDWSPQGEWIVFVSQVEGRFQLFRMRPDGSGRTQVTRGAGDHLNPSWSPDGRLIVFSGDAEGSQDLYLVRADGTGRTRLTWSPHDETEPAWGPAPPSDSR